MTCQAACERPLGRVAADKTNSDGRIPGWGSSFSFWRGCTPKKQHISAIAHTTVSRPRVRFCQKRVFPDHAGVPCEPHRPVRSSRRGDLESCRVLVCRQVEPMAQAAIARVLVQTTTRSYIGGANHENCRSSTRRRAENANRARLTRCVLASVCPARWKHREKQGCDVED